MSGVPPVQPSDPTLQLPAIRPPRSHAAPDEPPTNPRLQETGRAQPQDAYPSGSADGRREPPGGTHLGRAGGIMALGTIASRGTGFLRTIAITAAIGVSQVGDSYNVANTTPNIIYDLLLGGVLTSVVVPVLVRASKDDEDGGRRFANSLLTLVALGLAVFTLVGVVAAPLIARIYQANHAEIPLTTTFMRWFLPQIVFYGIGATIGAILNIRGRFGAPTVTPVLNNLFVIAVAIVFIFLPGGKPPKIDNLTTTQVTVLGAGTTIGVIAMTIALLPSLRRSGFRYRPQLDLRHPGLRQAVRLAGWVLLYVGVTQLSFFVVTRLATGTVAFTTYSNAYQLFQLPYAIVGVSVITALLPRMSSHAADRRLDLVRGDLSTGLRMSAVVLVPAALGLVVLAQPIAVAVFAHGRTSVGDATHIGAALAAFGVALLPFSAFQVQLRAFYAMADSRTPALVGCAVAAVNIVAGLAFASLFGDRDRAVALALAFALGYAVGAVVCLRLLHRRLKGIDGPRLVRTVVRCLVAGVLAAALAYAISKVLRSAIGDGVSGSLVAVLAAAVAGGVLYVVAASRMTEELKGVLALVKGRLRRS